MKVQDVMTEDVKFCGPDTNLARATAVMWENDCGVLPVVTDDRKAIGVITDRDIAVALGTRNEQASEIPVKEVMTGEPYTTLPEDDIHTALKIMRKEQVRRLLVVNTEGVLNGILCLNDIALQAVHSDDKKRPEISYEDVVSTLKAICEHRRPGLEEQYRTAST
jgi:CBS domain-containing protein